MRIRTVKPEFHQDEEMSEVSAKIATIIVESIDVEDSHSPHAQLSEGSHTERNREQGTGKGKEHDISSDDDCLINAGSVADSEMLKEWLGLYFEGNLYHGNNHDPCQVLRNCVHPILGESILERMVS